MKQGLLFLAIAFLSSSCAAIISGKHSNVNVRTDKTTNLVVEGDTILRDSNETVYLKVENDRAPLKVTAFDSTDSKPYYIRSKTSPAYWLNGFSAPFFFSGFLLDEIIGLKKKYPRNVYIYTEGGSYGYLPYFPMDSTLLERKNKITFAPISIVHEYHPAFEFGYERLHKNNFATQVTLGVFRSWDNNFARNSKGIKASIEEKYFFRNQTRTRFYASFVFEHHRKTHEADLDFVTVDNQGIPQWENGQFRQRTEVEKRLYGFTPRIGFQTYVTDRLMVEGFFGMGLRHRNVRHLNVDPSARYDTGFWEWLDIDYESNRPGRNVTSNWDLNFRIGWVF